MKNAPSVSEPLLAYINQKFPERCADPQDSDREIWMKSGERRVFRHLVAGSTIPARLKGGGGAGGGGGGAGIELPKHMTTLSLRCFVFYFGTCKLLLSVGTHVSRLISSIFLGLNLGDRHTFRETFG